ncbi:LLM class flavin-dependent oxidoreductase [Mycetocola tolaasinivorans]|uniref:LLM class flavin-dependent oxidoreductase n=1 Tax=Mycetocola tolaasinivorans TaxID=76635 RepID=A0A3L7A9V4_9MICO|nr:LLM class flavin-dependent oxidoreductase [Mycetocola tolaasinivorans]RLP77083.1 LLM class flavin-dependent oxidoreductase [Mycetocola tolaasinivorans]
MSASPTPRRQVHLAGHFPGVNHTTVWSDPTAGSQVDFDSFEHLARTAERGLLDYVFLAEGLRLREHKGAIHDLDVVGRPASPALLAALSAVTERIGLVATVNSTFNDPADLARQFGTLDALSSGRAGWNVVTSSEEFFGANFRRGGFLQKGDRYDRASEVLRAAAALWRAAPGSEVSLRGAHLRLDHVAAVHPGPQGAPVIVQAGDSPDGRDFAAAHAEVIFSPHADQDAAARYAADLTTRLERVGRGRESLRILPGATFVLGDTEAEARERSREVAWAQVSPQTAIATVERIWGLDLTDYDPEGPLPSGEPAEDELRRGQAPDVGQRRQIAAAWRARAEAEDLNLRETVIATTSRHTLVGTPGAVAERIAANVATGAVDGYVLVPHLQPHGLDEFVDRVIPELQERGVYRTEYPEGRTLRDILDLPTPPLLSGEPWATVSR